MNEYGLGLEGYIKALFTNHICAMSVKSFEYQSFTDLITGHFTQRTLHVACLAVIPGEGEKN